MLQRDGFKEESRWMLDIGRAEMPEYFTMKGRHSTAGGH